MRSTTTTAMITTPTNAPIASPAIIPGDRTLLLLTMLLNRLVVGGGGDSADCVGGGEGVGLGNNGGEGGS